MSCPLKENTIAQLLEEEDDEEEIVSEKEDFEEHSEHDSETEQEASDSDTPLDSEENFNSHLPDQQIENEGIYKEYLEDVPLNYRRLGKFIGKDKRSEWQVREPPRRVRTRSHNIILHLPGPIGEGKCCSSMLEAWDLIFPVFTTKNNPLYKHVYSKFGI
ncbi:unnamed protein product [Parnassius apollo]|uniref:(apollo) hypothetical protein n=1 Tax=Parnassius apollo TaxID=110799 RepID=A0A8S3WMF1_PARAO|nr:unnamed protein product [Parnassius apollo]